MSATTRSENTGKELLLKTLRRQPAEGVPWVPFAGVHAGKLKGYTAREVLTDGQKLLESLLAVNELYAPDGQPVMFDLQVEAEILGCKLLWAEDAPPSVASHPLAASTDIPSYLPQPKDGRLPMILAAMRAMQKKVGQHTALYGLVTGPFTLAGHLRGTEVFMDSVLNTEFLTELMAYTTQVTRQMVKMYIEAGMDVIAVVDPLISQIGPHHFTEFCAEPFTQIFSAIRAQGALSSLFVCGDATKNLQVMCQTGPDCLSIDENIDLPAAKKITDAHNVVIGGNLPLTTTMLLGTQQDNIKYVLNLLDQLEPRHFILSPGCDMPYDVPVENVIGVIEAVRHPAHARQMLANYNAPELHIEVELPDYAVLTKPLVEVFTLDSASCPACGYMLRAAERVAAEMAGQIELVEYKFTRRENVARMKKMGVQHLPAIYINGQLKYSSIIPSNEDFLAEVKTYLNGHRNGNGRSQ